MFMSYCGHDSPDRNKKSIEENTNSRNTVSRSCIKRCITMPRKMVDSKNGIMNIMMSSECPFCGNEKNIGTYGRYDGAAKYIDPREE